LPGGPVTITYTYDKLDRLIDAVYSDGHSYHYTYDSVGNRLSQQTTVNGQSSTVNYVYDAANRLTSVDGVAYTYDNNGNLLDDGVYTYTYDGANRLSAINRPLSTIRYYYNGLGDRLETSIVPVNGIGGQTTIFTMDLASGLTQVLDDGTNTYLYGNGRIAQVNTAGTEYFLGDALGSVRQMTDASGAVTLAKSYDPYGQLRTNLQIPNSQSTDFGFTGEQTDPTGLLFLRARYYDANVGRFTSRDSFPGLIETPQSLNRYAYALGNPVLYTDPSGNCVEGVTALICAGGAGAAIGIGINIYTQLQQHEGRWNCLDPKEIFIAGAVGAVAGVVFVATFGAILPTVGATLPGFMLAGGLAGVLTGLGARMTDTVLRGDLSDQAAYNIANPQAILTDFAGGAIGGAVGYGLNALLGAVANKYRTFYHATSPEFGTDIIDHIDLNQGRIGLDFNPAGVKGFYMTDDLTQGWDWIYKRFNNNGVLVKFQVRQSALDALNGKVFNGPMDEWASFVTEGRMNTLQHNYDFVEGPMLKNPRQVIGEGAYPEAKGYQLAIFSQKAADVFDASIRVILHR